MAATNSKVVQIHNVNGETNQYVKVSARIPDFLKVYGPEKGYRVLSQATDYLDFAQGRKELCVALAAQGKLPEQHIKEFMEERRVVFKSQLVDKEGNVVAESSAIKAVWYLKDYETGETAAFQRLLARLGFGGEVFDSDEDNDMQAQGLSFDSTSGELPSPSQTVVKKPVEMETFDTQAQTPVADMTKTASPTEQTGSVSKPAQLQVVDTSKSRGVKADPNKIQPAQLRQLESLARVKRVECPQVNTPEEFRKVLLELKSLPLPT
ncbi:hypothetical protein LCGC14_0874740 [marine sediment metagenome]|uniref:Uncharacterized protein n=1 Tax=marine sediment metagenome TaxID=412755 RepID=A0A0F9P3M9_9ZZZZ